MTDLVQVSEFALIDSPPELTFDLQDDIMIDIIALPDGAILMSIESSENIMNMCQAESIVTRWAKLVQDCLY